MNTYVNKQVLLNFYTSIFILFFVLSIVTVQAQVLEVFDTQDPPYTVDNLITNVLLGEGVEVVNINFEGAEDAIGYFQKGINDVGLERGIILTTGTAKSRNASIGADSPADLRSDDDNGSTATDSDITSIATNNIFNLSKYEITFIPLSDTLRFRYVFASEEYPEFTCASFNDIFGFFISGPNPNGGNYTSENLAIIPGTNLPVAINNIHGANPDDPDCMPINEEYYNDNAGNLNLVYDAYLDVFVAEAVVVPCQEYTLKMVIADQGDSQYDSAVFFEAKSFGTTLIDVTTTTVSVDGSIVEACSNATVSFSLPYVTETDVPVTFDIIGSATNGVDYINVSNNITIPSGSNSVSITIDALEDNIVEGIETVGIDVQRDACKRDTFWVNIRDNDLIPPDLVDTITVCTGSPAALDATISNAPTSTTTFNNSTTTVIHPINTSIYSAIEVSGVSPLQLGPETIVSVCIDSLMHPRIADLDIYLISPSGAFIELTTDNGEDGGNGNGDDFYAHTCFTPNSINDIKFGNATGAPASAVPFTGDFQPEGYFEDLWNGNNPSNGTWQLHLLDDMPMAIGQLFSWSITFNNAYQINYEWTPSTGLSCADCPNPTASPSATTTYTVVATDSYGCSVMDDVTVRIIDALAAPTLSCDNSVSGEITFTWDEIAGANMYEVNINGTGWTPANQAPTGHLVNGLTIGVNVTIEVRAIGDCETSPIATQNCELMGCTNALIDIANLTNVTCFGTDNGSILLNASGGFGNLSFTLGSETNTSGEFSNLAPNNYTLIVTDEAACSTSFDFTISEPSPLNSSAVIQSNTDCTTQALTFDVTGGTAPYSFSWSDALTDSINMNIAVGNYYVTITDANNCIQEDSILLTSVNGLGLNEVLTEVACHNATTASIAILPSGGNGIFSYNWDNGSTDSLLTNLGAGVYALTLSDSNGCTAIETYTLSNPEALQLQLNPIPTTCFNTLDGSVAAVASGGTSSINGFEYNWNTTETTPTISNLGAGNYILTITDENGCTTEASTNVMSPPAILLQTDSTNVSCANGADGMAVVMASGGSGNLSYLWEDGSTNNQVNDLSANIYQVTITDVANCTATATFQINAPAPISITSSITNATCGGTETGAIDLEVTGGTGMLSYLWDNTNTSQDLTNISAGVYTLLVTDENACTTEEVFSVSSENAVINTFSITDVDCFGTSSGGISISSSGGSQPLSYEWSSGQTTATLEDIPSGTYSLTVTDSEGCETLETIVIDSPEGIIDGIAEVTDISCQGADDASITVEVTGGTSPYLVSLSGEPFTSNTTFTGLGPNDYIIFIEDANGCVASLPSSVAITEPEMIAVNIGDDLSIPIGQTINLNSIVENSFGLVEYEWSGTETTGLSCLNCPNPNVNIQGTTIYELTVTDQNGCIASDLLTIYVNNQVEVLVPTGFTPNGDALNDRLLVHGKSDKIKAINVFRIYDRWGDLIFQEENFDINDENKGWDGSFQGKEMPTGVYVWYLEMTTITGKVKNAKGETTLIR